MKKPIAKRRGRPPGIKDRNNVEKPKRKYTWRTIPAETVAAPKGRKIRNVSHSFIEEKPPGEDSTIAMSYGNRTAEAKYNPFDPASLDPSTVESFKKFLDAATSSKLYEKDQKEEKSVVKKKGRPKGSKSGYPILKKRVLNSKSEAFQTSKFQDGNAGGPGRPKGSRNKMTLALAKIGEDNVEDVFKRLVDIALGKIIGDAKACKAVIDTAITLRKITPINFELPAPIETTEDLNKFSKKVINMAAEGEISAEEAMEYGKLCEQELKMMTDTDVVKKIENTCMLVDLIKKGS